MPSDSSKEPIIGVSVTAKRKGSQIAATTTDSKGSYRIDIESGDKLSIAFEHSAYNTLEENNVPGDKDQDISRVLEPLDEIGNEGIVVSVSEGKLVIADKAGGNEKAIQVSPDAKLTLNGKEAKLADIKKGDKAKITVNQSGKVTSISFIRN